MFGSKELQEISDELTNIKEIFYQQIGDVFNQRKEQHEEQKELEQIKINRLQAIVDELGDIESNQRHMKHEKEEQRRRENKAVADEMLNILNILKDDAHESVQVAPNNDVNIHFAFLPTEAWRLIRDSYNFNICAFYAYCLQHQKYIARIFELNEMTYEKSNTDAKKQQYYMAIYGLEKEMIKCAEEEKRIGNININDFKFGSNAYNIMSRQELATSKNFTKENADQLAKARPSKKKKEKNTSKK